jgi:hypothetical protein
VTFTAAPSDVDAQVLKKNVAWSELWWRDVQGNAAASEDGGSSAPPPALWQPTSALLYSALASLAGVSFSSEDSVVVLALAPYLQVASVALHVVSVALATRIGSVLFRDMRAAAVAVGVFAVHPMVVDVVVCGGRVPELLCGALCLLSLLLFLQACPKGGVVSPARLVASLLAAVLAAGSHPTGVSVFPFIVALDVGLARASAVARELVKVVDTQDAKKPASPVSVHRCNRTAGVAA